MLEDIEHEDPVEGLGVWGLIGGIEAANFDAVAKGAIVCDEASIRFNAADVPEVHQGVEEKAIAAADVEDAAGLRVRVFAQGNAAEPVAHEAFTRPPPPVVFPEVLVLLGVAGLHGGK